MTNLGVATRVSHARSGANISYAYSVLLFIYVCLLASFYAEFRGDGFVTLIGSYNLWATDMAVVASLPMLWFSVTGISRSRAFARTLLLLWLAIAFFWLFRAVQTSPFEASRSFRPYASYCIGLLAFSLRPIDDKLFERVANAYIICGAAIAVLVFLRVSLGSTLFVPADSGGLWAYAVDRRPIQAPAALILAEAILFLFFSRSNTILVRSRWLGAPLKIALLVALAASGQRTAAAAALAGLIASGISVSRHKFGTWLNPITSLTGIAALSAMLGMTVAQFISVLPESFTSGNAARDFGLRIQIWQSIIDQFMRWPLLDQLFGKADTWTLYWYLISGSSIHADTRSAHNEFFGSLLFTGVVGISVLACGVLIIMMTAVRRAGDANAKNRSGLHPSLILGLAAALLVYSISYEWLYEQGVILALCAAGWVPTRTNRTLRRR